MHEDDRVWWQHILICGNAADLVQALFGLLAMSWLSSKCVVTPVDHHASVALFTFPEVWVPKCCSL